MIIVGGGNIGRAMARSDSFPRNGLRPLPFFDRDEKRSAGEVDGLFVQDIDCMERFVREHPVDSRALAVPARAAQAGGVTVRLRRARVLELCARRPVPAGECSGGERASG